MAVASVLLIDFSVLIFASRQQRLVFIFVEKYGDGLCLCRWWKTKDPKIVEEALMLLLWSAGKHLHEFIATVGLCLERIILLGICSVGQVWRWYLWSTWILWYNYWTFSTWERFTSTSWFWRWYRLFSPQRYQQLCRPGYRCQKWRHLHRWTRSVHWLRFLVGGTCFRVDREKLPIHSSRSQKNCPLESSYRLFKNAWVCAYGGPARVTLWHVQKRQGFHDIDVYHRRLRSLYIMVHLYFV